MSRPTIRQRLGAGIGSLLLSVGRTLSSVGIGVGGGAENGGRRFRGLEAGRLRQTDPDFMPPMEGPDLQAQKYLRLARLRTRWLCENHPLLAGARETYVRNVAGVEPYPEPNTGDRAIDKQVRALMWKFYRHADVSREKSIADIYADGLREYFAVGELFAHRFTAPAFRRLPAGPAIETIDTDRLPLDSGMFAFQPFNGPTVRMGVEFDQLKRRVAYHVYEAHPADAGVMTTALRTRKIDAERATLGFNALRSSQARGLPHCAAISSSSREEDTFRDTAIFSAKAAAAVAYLFKGPRPPDAKNANTLTDADGNVMREIWPGMVGWLPQGAEFIETNQNRPGPQFVQVMELLSRRMAAGVGMSYTAFTRDSSKATFAAQRADSLEDRRGYRIAQRRSATWVLLPWYRDVIDFGVATGQITLDSEQLARFIADPSWLYEHTLVFSGWEWVNPAQEASAAAVELELGTTSRKRLAANAGAHWQDVIDEEIEVEKYEADERKKAGLPPRQAAGTGQPSNPSADPNADPSADPQNPDAPGDAPPDQTPPGGSIRRGARLRAHLDRLAAIAASESAPSPSLNGVHA